MYSLARAFTACINERKSRIFKQRMFKRVYANAQLSLSFLCSLYTSGTEKWEIWYVSLFKATKAQSSSQCTDSPVLSQRASNEKKGKLQFNSFLNNEGSVELMLLQSFAWDFAARINETKIRKHGICLPRPFFHPFPIDQTLCIM